MESLDQLEVSTTAEKLSDDAPRWPALCVCTPMGSGGVSQGHPDFYRRELVDVELPPRCAKPLQSHLHH